MNPIGIGVDSTLRAKSKRIPSRRNMDICKICTQLVSYVPKESDGNQKGINPCCNKRFECKMDLQSNVVCAHTIGNFTLPEACCMAFEFEMMRQGHVYDEVSKMAPDVKEAWEAVHGLGK